MSTRKLVVVALGLAASLVACSNDGTIPEPPPPPPQIATSVTYSTTHDDKGQPNGLPSNDVYAFLTVSNGELWVGTVAGVARFASVNASTLETGDVVNEVNGLPHPFVKSMVEFDGKVYVGTWGGGLGIYDIAGDVWTQIRPTPPERLGDGFIAEIAVSPSESKLYMATNDGVYIYEPATDTFTHFSTVDDDLNELAPDYFDTVRMQSIVSSLEVTDDGVVQRWYGPRVEVKLTPSQLSLHGIKVSKDVSTVYKYTPTNSGLIEPNVNDIYFDSVRNTYWVSYVNKGISEVNLTDKTWTSHTLVQGLPSNTVYSVTRAGDGAGGTTMWAATQGGLAKLEGSHWQPYGRSGGLPSDRVRRVYSDDGKRLWVGLINAGAVRVKV
jgi:hypothetical protein